MGGRLMTGVSADTAGIANWTIKRDWRRDLEEEIRSEGYDLFVPNYLAADPPPTGGQPITLIAQATRLNGQIAIVVGTQTTLWRYTGVADQDWEYDVNATLGTGYVADGYSQSPPGTWMQIGSGFSTSGRRWEALSIAGYLVLNNGVDLPVTYQVQDVSVVPIYELREQGVASVGTIAEVDGILVCSDLKLIKGNPVFISGTVVSQAELRGQPTTALFTTADPHGLNNGVPVTVTGMTNPLLSSPGPVAITVIDSHNFIYQTVGLSHTTEFGLGTYDIMTNLMNGPDPYGLVDDSLVDEYKARVTWSAPNQPNRFAAIIPCTVSVFSNALTLKYPVSSIVPGMSILLVGAGIDGGNLTGTVIYVNGLTVTMGDQVITNAQKDVATNLTNAQNAVTAAQQYKTYTAASVTSAQSALTAAIAGGNASTIASAQASLSSAVLVDNQAAASLSAAQATLAAAQTTKTINTEFIASDMFGGIAGQFEDLEGDGAGVLKMLKLRQYLIIYTESRIFVASYTGNTSGPFSFEMIDIPEGTALHYRDTLVLLSGAGHYSNGFAFGGAAHVYAGRNAFYRFDLTNQVPMEMPEFQPCQDVFFNGALGSEVFAVDNPVIKEILFCFPDISTPDKALRWDYRFGTISTTGVAITAAAGVTRPEAQIITGQTEQWFVMGTPDGKLLRYGFIASNAEDSRVASISGGLITVTKLEKLQTVTCSDNFFTPSMIGWSIISDLTGTVMAITGYTNAKTVTVLGTGIVTAETFRVVGAIWHRAGLAYDSTLQSGLDSFGNQGSRKIVDRYTVMLGSNSTDGALTAVIRGATNPRDGSDLVTISAPKPQTTNMFPLGFTEGFFIGDRVIASGINNPFRMTCRIFDLHQTNARGYGRQ